MKTELIKLLQMQNFFKIIELSNNTIKYVFKDSSRVLMNNIYINWLWFLHEKTYKHMTVYVGKNKHKSKNNPLPFGVITKQYPNYNDKTIIKHKLDHLSPEYETLLEFKIMIPNEDFMQYFTKWQRYRKFWWSSVTTTPSLFKIDEIQQHNREANLNILAQFPFGSPTVERVTVTTDDNSNELKHNSILKCTLSLEGALFILLFDAFTNNSKEEYLRLHRKMAPYKFGIALDTEGVENLKDLSLLATLLHHQLKMKKIPSVLPNYSLPLNIQIKETLQIGVPYTAILNKVTLENGIFKLMNSSTMMKEQVHVADFDNYATVLCSGK